MSTSNNVTEANTSTDYAKWAIAIGLLVLGIFGFYHYSEEQPAVVRVLGMLVLFGLAAYTAFQTQKGVSTWGFLKDARTEVRKVVWPTRQETLQTTLAVVVMVIITGILLWLLDMFLLWAVQILTGQGG